MSTLLISEYQESLSTVLVLSPELYSLFYEYLNTFVVYATLNTSSVIAFDLYINNLNFYYGEGCVQLFLFFLYVFFMVYSFTTIFLLRWVNFLISHFLRFYYYFYSISKETRIQFEAITQTMVFFLIY
jgi:hypothetical protein